MRPKIFLMLLTMLIIAAQAGAQVPEKPVYCPGQAATEDITALKSSIEKATAELTTIQSVADKRECFHTSPLARDLGKLAGKRTFRGIVNYHYYDITNAGNFFSVKQVEFKAEAGAANAERLLKKAGGTFRSPGLTQYQMIRKGNRLLFFIYSMRALTDENSALIDAIKKNYESM